MFNRVKFINLAGRVDRRKHMEQQLQKFPNVERFEAVDVKQVKPLVEQGVDDVTVSESVKENIRNKIRKRHCEIDSWAQVACFYSHLNIWRELLYTEKDWDATWFIFEDDVVIHNPNVLQDMSRLNLPPNYDLIFFDVIRRKPFVRATEDCFRLGLFWGTHAYLITRKGAEKLISLVEQKPIDMQVDGFIYHHLEIEGKDTLQCFSVNKGWFRQDEAKFGTDVQVIYHAHLDD
jgi:GR25 family glycosyltransferase involved in LPS biosynthesis